MLLYVRHGESQANVDFVFAGQRNDSPLTKLGEQQAQTAGSGLLEQHIRIDRIISSPLVRALQTAEIIAGIIGYDAANIVLDKRISEYDMGELSGKTRKSVTSEEIISAKGAESVDEFKKRILSFVNEYSKDTDTNILFSTHAGVGRMLRAIKSGIETEKFYDLDPYPNAHVTEIKL